MEEKYYYVRNYSGAGHIYNDMISKNKIALIEAVRKDLEENILLEPIQLKEEDCWLFINDDKNSWLKLHELKCIE